MTTPFIGFGNDTLKNQPEVKPGDKFICPTCNNEHVLFGGDNGETLLLGYYCEDGKMYLGAVGGRLIAGLKPDVKGRF